MNRKQRHLGRELALLWLFQVDVGRVPIEEALSMTPDEIKGVEEEGLEFGQQLVRGVYGERRRIDQMIVKYARGWSLARVAGIERNVIRISIYELLQMPDIPASVSIDEAVEMAKRYGSEESGKFVNGILGAFVRGELQNPEVA